MRTPAAVLPAIMVSDARRCDRLTSSTVTQSPIDGYVISAIAVIASFARDFYGISQTGLVSKSVGYVGFVSTSQRHAWHTTYDLFLFLLHPLSFFSLVYNIDNIMHSSVRPVACLNAMKLGYIRERYQPCSSKRTRDRRTM